MNSQRWALVLALLAVSASAFAGGRLEIIANDSMGKAKVAIEYMRWDGEQYSHVRTRPANGRDVITLAPGRYKVRVTYRETIPNQVLEQEGIEMVNAGSETHAFYFGKGWAEISTKDNDGVAECNLHYARWDEAKRKYIPLTSKENKLGRGRNTIAMAPGKYRVIARYRESVPRLEHGIAVFQINDGEIMQCTFDFFTGPIDKKKLEAAPPVADEQPSAAKKDEARDSGEPRA